MTTNKQRRRQLSQSIADVGPLMLIEAAVIAIALLGGLRPPQSHGATVAELIAQLQRLDHSAPVKVRDGKRLADPNLQKDFDGTIIFSPAADVAVPVPPPLANHRYPYGPAALQPGQQGSNNPAFPFSSRLVSLAQLRDPDVAGYTIRFTMHQVRTDKNIWDKIGACITNARAADKWYTLLPMGGEPITSESLGRHDNVLTEVAKRWGNDPLFAGYHIAGYVSPPGVSEELHWKQGMSTNNENWLIDYAHRARKALPGVTLILALGQGDDAGMRRIAMACRDCSPILVKNNNLRASSPALNFANWPNAPHNRLLVEIAKDPAIGIGEEMVGATTWSDTGSKNINDSLKQMAVLATRAGEKPGECYVAVYPEDIAAVNAGVLAP